MTGTTTNSNGGLTADPDVMRRVGRGSSVNLAGTVVSALSTFALTIVVTRGVPADRAGVFFSCTSIFVLLTTIGQMGTQTGLVYFIGRARALDTPGLVLGYVRQAIRPVLAVALVMGASLFIFAPRLAELTNPGHVGIATSYLRALAVLVPLVGVEQVYLAATRGLGTMRPNALVELISRPVLQLLLVWLSILLAVHFLAWSWALAYAPAAAISWLWWRRLAARFTDDHSASGRNFWLFTGPRAATNIVQAAMQRLDIVLLGALGSPIEAAVYTAATRFVVAGQMGNGAISLSAQPALAQSLARNDRAGTQHIYQTSTAWLMAVTWPLYLFLACYGETLLAVFGGRYGAGSAALLLLSLTMLVATGLGMVDMLLAMAGHTTWNLGNAACALVVQLGLDIWLIPDHGVSGAAIGWSAAILVRNIFAAAQVGWALRLHPFGRAPATCGLLSLACFAVVPFTVRATVGSTWSGMLVAAVLGGVLFLGGCWVLRDQLELKALVRNRRKR